MKSYASGVRKIATPGPAFSGTVEEFFQRAWDLGYRVAAWNGQVFSYHVDENKLPYAVPTALEINDFAFGSEEL